MKQAPPERGWREQSLLTFKYLRNRYLYQHRLDVGPLLIVGCGHSGTTLLLAMLGSHPWLHPVSYETNFGFMSPEEARACLRRIQCEALAEGRRGWVEKTPRHILCIPRLLELIPDARILLIIRDGRDVAVSIKHRTGSLDKGITRWVEQNRVGEESWGLERVYRIKYEDLVEDPVACLKGVCCFAGLPYSTECLEYHTRSLRFYSDNLSKPESAAGDNHAQYRNWQINQPMFDGRGKWRELTPEDKALIKRRVGKMLIEYGYTVDDSW